VHFIGAEVLDELDKTPQISDLAFDEDEHHDEDLDVGGDVGGLTGDQDNVLEGVSGLVEGPEELVGGLRGFEFVEGGEGTAQDQLLLVAVLWKSQQFETNKPMLNHLQVYLLIIGCGIGVDFE
jgi:hypothetical protein